MKTLGTKGIFNGTICYRLTAGKWILKRNSTTRKTQKTLLEHMSDCVGPFKGRISNLVIIWQSSLIFSYFPFFATCYISLIHLPSVNRVIYNHFLTKIVCYSFHFPPCLLMYVIAVIDLFCCARKEESRVVWRVRHCGCDLFRCMQLQSHSFSSPAGERQAPARDRRKPRTNLTLIRECVRVSWYF